VGLPGQQRPSERLWATTPRRLADKPAPSLHSAQGSPNKSPARETGLSWSSMWGLPTRGREQVPPTQHRAAVLVAQRPQEKAPPERG
jgi:hypothetical protein